MFCKFDPGYCIINICRPLNVSYFTKYMYLILNMFTAVLFHTYLEKTNKNDIYFGVVVVHIGGGDRNFWLTKLATSRKNKPETLERVELNRNVMYTPFHKTLPIYSLQMLWISERFYEMVDSLNIIKNSLYI